ncbi:hypothetical protein [Rhodococcus opacus]|uniref:hypothetical protein n=1 Tax=Rhodococcus opacus TaxID=37919 RepID=UPI001C440964|nr:hypothetical protein [Rhodococcus opacus]MBV6754848.1 hypothetical protein [Rhodococcus opacus]
MSNGIALWKGDTWDTGWGSVTLDEQCELTLTTTDGQVSIPMRLDGSAFVDAYAGGSWVCLMGAAGSQVVLARREGPSLHVIAEVNRIGAGTRTAIGTHAVRFHPRPETDQCVLAWEIGVALIDPHHGVVWSHVHGDPDQRVLAMTEATAELRGLHAMLTVDLATGAVETREQEQRMAVDRATLVAWRQGIGR